MSAYTEANSKSNGAFHPYYGQQGGVFQDEKHRAETPLKDHNVFGSQAYETILNYRIEKLKSELMNKFNQTSKNSAVKLHIKSITAAIEKKEIDFAYNQFKVFFDEHKERVFSYFFGLNQAAINNVISKNNITIDIKEASMQAYHLKSPFDQTDPDASLRLAALALWLFEYQIQNTAKKLEAYLILPLDVRRAFTWGIWVLKGLQDGCSFGEKFFIERPDDPYVFIALELMAKNGLNVFSSVTRDQVNHLYSNRASTDFASFQKSPEYMQLMNQIKSELMELNETSTCSSIKFRIKSMATAIRDNTNSAYLQPTLFLKPDPLLKAFYVKAKPEGNVLTPGGVELIIDQLRHSGKLTTECLMCENYNVLKNALQTFIDSPEDKTMSFIVKSIPPFDHITPIHMRKKAGEIQVVLMDTQGGESWYDPSALFTLQNLNIPNLKVYNLIERRQWDKTNTAVFALHDLMTMSRHPNFFEHLETQTQARAFMKLSNTVYQPDLTFIPLYLNDLPIQFQKYTTELQTLERNLYKRNSEESQKLKDKVKAATGNLFVEQQTITANLLAFKRFQKYEVIIDKILTHFR